MKAIARSHFWWPNLDKDIEDTVRSCHHCARTATTHIAHHYHPGRGLSNCGREYILTFHLSRETLPLIVVDAHSKQPEIIVPMVTTTVEATTDALRTIFARLGVPEGVVCDSGPPFQ